MSNNKSIQLEIKGLYNYVPGVWSKVDINILFNMYQNTESYYNAVSYDIWQIASLGLRVIDNEINIGIPVINKIIGIFLRYTKLEFLVMYYLILPCKM